MYDVRVRVNSMEKKVLEYEQDVIQEDLIMFYGESAFTRWNETHDARNMEDDIRRKECHRIVVSQTSDISASLALLCN